MADLAKLHSDLRLHLKTLRDERGRLPVYLIEHALDDAQLQALAELLSTRLPRQPFERNEFWNTRYLPVLVLAAEVGYSYGSEGSDYWPALEARLHASLDNKARDTLQEYFEQQARLTGVVPIAAPRTEQFHRIAWPLAHALLPKYLHSSLVELVQQVRKSLPGTPGPTFVQELTQLVKRECERSEEPKHRLLPTQPEVLESLVAAVVLEEPPPDLWLSGPVWQRLSAELKVLSHAGATRRLITSSRRPLRLPSTDKTAAGETTAPLTFKRRELPLVLEKRGKKFLLRLQLPTMPAPLLELEDLEALAEHRLRLHCTPRLTRLKQLLTDETLELDDGCLASKRSSGSPELVQKESLMGLPPELSKWLASLYITTSLPLLMKRQKENLAVQYSSRLFTVDAVYWLISNEQVSLVQGVVRAGSFGQYTVYEVTPAKDAAAQWLKELGCKLQEVNRFRLLHLPFVREQAATTGTLLKDDPLFLEVVGAGLRCGPKSAAELLPGLYRLLPAQSSLSLSLAGACEAQVTIDWDEQLPSPRSLITSRWSSPVSCEALSSELLQLELSAPFTMYDLTMIFELHNGREVLSRQELSVSIPCVIEVASRLEELVCKAESSRSRSLRLTASIPKLMRRVWELERQADVSSSPVRLRDLWTSNSWPWELRPAKPQVVVDALLCQPVDKDEFPCLGHGVISGQGALKLHAFSAEEPRARRQLEAEGVQKGEVALRGLCYAYLSWYTATVRESSYGLLRSKILRKLELKIVEVLCGPDWSKAESTLKSVEDPSSFLVEKLFQSGDLKNEDWLRVLGADAERRVKRDLVKALQFLSPAIKATLGAAIGELEEGVPTAAHPTLLLSKLEKQVFTKEMMDQLGRQIETQGNAVYTHLLSRNDSAEHSEVDLYVDTSSVQTALSELLLQQWKVDRLDPLPQLILPRWLVRKLEQLSSHPASLERLSKRLFDWLELREKKPSRWLEQDVLALLKLWCTTQDVQKADVDALGVAIADRQGSRAIRFAALRWRAIVRRGYVHGFD